ncbi:MAG: hypothetical protein IV092_02235 [Burkholderiaceae bacterium]|nr:hypothetical protein [Burkholderiaceae bacterium]
MGAEFEAKVKAALVQLENEGLPFTTTKLLERADVNRTTLYTKSNADGSAIHEDLLEEIQKSKMRVISKSKTGSAVKRNDDDEPRRNDLLKKLKVAAGELLVLNAQLSAETQLREVAMREARRWATEAYALGCTLRRLCIAGALPSAVSSVMGEIERRQLADVDEAACSSDALLAELVIHLSSDGGPSRSLRNANPKVQR